MQDALHPQVLANQQAQQQTLQNAQLQSKTLQGFYNALAQLQGQAPQQIDQTYSAAADRQAAFGKGFSDAQQHLMSQTQGQSNQLLAQNGSPQTVDTNPQGAADALYYTGRLQPGVGV